MYRLYGLTLQSRLALPCRRTSERRPDVRLIAGTQAQFADLRAMLRARPRDWFHCHQLPEGETYLHWTDHFEFLVSRDGRRIWYRSLGRATRDSLQVYLLGQVLSFSLIARGRDPLHGTVVACSADAAIAFAAECGAGKSTLGAAMLARGCRIVTDDVVALDHRDGRWYVHPGIPRLKLFPSVARALLGPHGDAGPMIRGGGKRVIPLSSRECVSGRLPLQAIYVLAEPRDGSAVAIEPLGGRDALLEIVRAAFNLIVLDRTRHANQFSFATTLSADVPVRRLTYPRDLSILPTVCESVLADAAAL
jgi:hypothetical protein